MRSGLRGSTGVHPPTSTRPIRGTGTRTHSGDRWPGRYRDPRCRACSASTPFASAMLQQRRQLRDRHRRGRPHRARRRSRALRARCAGRGRGGRRGCGRRATAGRPPAGPPAPADVPLGGPEAGAAPLQPRHPRRVLLTTGDERAVEDHAARGRPALQLRQQLRVRRGHGHVARAQQACATTRLDVGDAAVPGPGELDDPVRPDRRLPGSRGDLHGRHEIRHRPRTPRHDLHGSRRTTREFTLPHRPGTMDAP